MKRLLAFAALVLGIVAAIASLLALHGDVQLVGLTAGAGVACVAGSILL